MKNNAVKFLLIMIALLSFGWGSLGHRIINKNSKLSFPTELNFLLYWADSLAAHASDADNRKGSDPNEAPKHFIDIDNYPEFVSTGRITQNFDSLVLQHGNTFVLDQGILPWAIMKTVDSLQAAFVQGDLQKAMLISADLGHYIGDAHMPLHLTRNYNGQYTGQSGIHSRYESSMIGTYQQQIIYNGDTVSRISNLSDFVFEMIYANYKYVDSVLVADLTAKSFAGGNYNSAYYQKLWELTKNFTIKLYKNASYDLARLIYTAWKNASGNPSITTLGIKLIPEGLYNAVLNRLNMKDTVRAYLRNVSSPYSKVDSAIAVIDSLTFTGNFSFQNVSTGSYYLSIIHRNSIETWSKSGGESIVKGNPISYDFTNSQSKAYGNNLTMVGSKWCIYSGDIIRDEIIDGSDVSDCFNDASIGQSGFVITDLTGDDFVDGTDVTIAFNNSNLGIGASYPSKKNLPTKNIGQTSSETKSDN
jgi:hypothetical protein